ncbi:unnamed protein product [Didymodactylos carnosus]|uniref:Endonuclease/exonuclease/phosphatase domain-containing protein n=1 Tax=Didymodactylos carnosus TaxID=1234261 RepID=A0A814S3A4_9BILA|nr:unnamed protein product [Didymodactylos carnosus]CAF3904510.1 unnamed protein product [Didymodactylos carnosus]
MSRPAVEVTRLPRSSSGETLKIGTWNVMSMLKKEKIENVKIEMAKNNLNVLGLAEVRWKEQGDFWLEKYRIIHCGNAKGGANGVAIILDEKTGKRVNKVVQHSDRLILVKIEAKPVDIVIVQVYMPTSAGDDEEVDKVYEQIDELVAIEKASDYLIITGDWNAVIGEGVDGKEVGNFGLGKRNERGEKLVEFCREKKLMVTNTWLMQEKRRRYTWKSPSGKDRYQLDYILVNQRFSNSVRKSCSYPGADVSSDHNLIMMRIRVKLKVLKKASVRRKWNLELLKHDSGGFRNEIECRMEKMKGRKSINESWNYLKESIIESAKVTIGYDPRTRIKKPWITDEMIEKMEERRKWKGINTEDGRKMYRKLNNELRRITDKANEDWWKRECNELELLNKQGKADLVYSMVKKLTGSKKAQSNIHTIKNKDGTLLTDPKLVRQRWKEYIEELYDQDGKPTEEEIDLESEMDVEVDNVGPGILEDEIEAAISQMKDRKA